MNSGQHAADDPILTRLRSGPATTRDLMEDRRAMPKAERLEVVKALREEGHSVRAIAGAVGSPPSTIQGDLEIVRTRTNEPERVVRKGGGTYPAKRDDPATKKGASRSPEANSQRVSRARELAAGGHSVEQIAADLGITCGGVRHLVARESIDVPAEQVLRKTRNPDAERIVSKTVANLEAEAMSLRFVPGDLTLDPSQPPRASPGLLFGSGSIRRLRGRGVNVVNLRPLGSHRGGEYVLVASVCARCGRGLASDHASDDLCSPCERAVFEEAFPVVV